MNKRKLSLIICSCVCVILAISVLVIAFTYSEPKHDHTLRDGKIYHIYTDKIYCTQQYADGCHVTLEADTLSLTDVFAGITEKDSVVLEEDITLTEEFAMNAFVNSDTNPLAEPQELDLNINLDLNGFTIYGDIENIEYDSMFRFNVNRGKLNLTISNGKLYSEDTSYIFMCDPSIINFCINSVGTPIIFL